MRKRDNTFTIVGMVLLVLSFVFALWCAQHKKPLTPMEASRNADTSNFDNLIRF